MIKSLTKPRFSWLFVLVFGLAVVICDQLPNFHGWAAPVAVIATLLVGGALAVVVTLIESKWGEQ